MNNVVWYSKVLETSLIFSQLGEQEYDNGFILDMIIDSN